MRSWLLKATAVALIAIVAAGALAGLVASGSSPQVFASRVAGIAGEGETGIQIQNLDLLEDAQIRANFYTEVGSLVEEINLPITPAGAASNIWLPRTNLPTGQYSAVMASDKPIAGIIRTDWPATRAAAIYSNVNPGIDVAIPLVVRQYNGQSSIISIQNSSETNHASVLIEMFEAGNNTPLAQGDYTIPPNASTTIDVEQDVEYAALGTRFLGSARVTTNTEAPVGVSTFVDIRTSDKAVYGFEGVPTDQASQTLYVPLFRAMQYVSAGKPESGRLDTGISVVNPGLGPAEVQITYYGSNDRAASVGCRGQTFQSPMVVIDARSSHVFYQGDPSSQNLPIDCFGSAVIQATSPVLAIVNDAQNEGLTSAAYNAVADGATRVALPLYRRDHAGGLSTGIQAMNVGNNIATVNVSFTRQFDDGTTAPVACAAPCQVQIAPNSSHTWWPPNYTEFESNSYGSAVITSDQPVTVIVNDADVTGLRDMATYNGIGIE